MFSPDSYWMVCVRVGVRSGAALYGGIPVLRRRTFTRKVHVRDNSQSRNATPRSSRLDAYAGAVVGCNVRLNLRALFYTDIYIIYIYRSGRRGH